MIGPEGELPKDAPEDAVSLELSDLRSGTCALVRLARTDGRTSARGLVCSGGEPVAVLDEPGVEADIESWNDAAAAGIGFETVEPLSEWRVRLEHEQVTLEVTAEAASVPIDFDEEATAPLVRATGVHRYEQLCRVRGTLRVGAASTDIDGVGRRVHAWGAPAGAGFRSIYAVGEARAVTVAAVRPPGAEGHGSELVAAFLIRPEEPPARFEDVRVSTVYDSAGRPRTAGLELFMPGDEYPRRVSGEAVCRPQEAGAGPFAACFRWSFEGESAQGGYQVARPG